ncbi:hypothetical protein GCM10011405_25530 [Rufibacter glacialis]|nr:hypothetical protein GCM10011405_25530 [Rufibacter glacialis]
MVQRYAAWAVKLVFDGWLLVIGPFDISLTPGSPFAMSEEEISTGGLNLQKKAMRGRQGSALSLQK